LRRVTGTKDLLPGWSVRRFADKFGIGIYQTDELMARLAKPQPGTEGSPAND
jgi:hypothetical protein